MARAKKTPTPTPPTPPPAPKPAGEIYCATPEAFAKITEKVAAYLKEHPEMVPPRILKGYEEPTPDA